MINEEEQGTDKESFGFTPTGDQEELFSSDTSLVTRSISRKTEDKNNSRKELCSAQKREAESDIDLEQGQEEDNPGPIAENYTHNRALDTLIAGPRSDSTESDLSNSSTTSSFRTVYEIITKSRQTKLLPLLIMKIIGLLYLLIEMSVKCSVD